MRITPIPGWVIARPLKQAEKKTESGIVLPGKIAENIRFVLGRVQWAAKNKYVGLQEVPMQIKINDLIYFDEHTSREFDWHGTRYFAVQEEKVYGVVDLNSKEVEELKELNEI